MAVKFETENPEETERESARTFIEVNTNQSAVPPAHLYAIKYPILGDTDAIALAAQVLIRVNQRRGALFGLLDTDQEVQGVIPPLTLLASLKSFLNPVRIRRAANSSRRDALLRKSGYEAVLGASDLTTLVGREATGANLNPELFINAGVSCIGRYFDVVQTVFPHDWLQRRANANTSTLRYAKVISAFIKLLQHLTDDGFNWQQINDEMRTIRQNILKARHVGMSARIVFKETHPTIPNATNRTRDITDFLQSNRRRPTSIATIVNAR